MRRSSFFPNKITSYSSYSPVIPGEPLGIPGTESPSASGFSRKNFSNAAAGTCPSIKYHLGGVTGLEIEWYAQSGLHTVEFCGLDHFHLEAVSFQVRDPTATATVVRVLVNGHRWPS